MRGASRTSNRMVNVFRLIALFVSVLGLVKASVWQTEMVDIGGGGKYTALTIDKAGNAHTAYFNEPMHELKYAFWDKRLKRWFHMAIDDRCAGFPSMALDSQQRPHIAYIEYGTGRLKYATWTGTSWKTQLIQLNAKLIEYYTSIVLDSEDRPTIAYYEVFGVDTATFELHMRTVKWTGGVWQVSTVDSDYASGKFNSMTVASDDTLHLAYANVKDETASLRYARWNAKTGWSSEVIEGANTPQRTFSVAIALDRRNIPHIAYTDPSKHLVRYATYRGDKWQFLTVDVLAQEGFPDRNGIALDEAGNPYITYHDAGRGMLKIAYLEGARWLAEVVDREFAGFTSSIQIHNGEIFIVYYDSFTNSLKCARRRLGPT